MKFNLFKKNIPGKEVEAEKVILRGNRPVGTMYHYEWNEDVPDNEKDTVEHPSRPFCQRMIQNDRYYTRFEIQEMSKLFGWSVFDKKGGNGCRHRWVQKIVVKKLE
jgi:hypothetical protein